MRATTKLAGSFGAVALLLASPALTQGVSWVRTPSAEELAAAYPEAAKRDGLPGHAWVGCQLTRQGVLKGCDVAAESPEGQGFGKAAVALAKLMQAAPRTDGPSEIPVTLPIHFGGPTQDHPMRGKVFQTSDGRFSVTDGRFRRLAPIGPYWPDNALRMGLAGRAAIDCKVDGKGKLSDCVMVGERTSHPMFGYATIAMARRGWMTAAPLAAGEQPPPDGIWRFEVDFPARTLADAR